MAGLAMNTLHFKYPERGKKAVIVRSGKKVGKTRSPKWDMMLVRIGSVMPGCYY